MKFIFFIENLWSEDQSKGCSKLYLLEVEIKSKPNGSKSENLDSPQALPTDRGLTQHTGYSYMTKR